MSNQIIYTADFSHIGPISVAVGPDGAEKISFGRPAKALISRLTPGDWIVKPAPQELRRWIERYQASNAANFPYKLNLMGTEFQIKVWRCLKKIPFGQTRSYGWVAKKIGIPGASRAVGNACGANPVPIVIPCHRVVAANNLGGFSSGITLKKKLLGLEGIDY